MACHSHSDGTNGLAINIYTSENEVGRVAYQFISTSGVNLLQTTLEALRLFWSCFQLSFAHFFSEKAECFQSFTLPPSAI